MPGLLQGCLGNRAQGHERELDGLPPREDADTRGGTPPPSPETTLRPPISRDPAALALQSGRQPTPRRVIWQSLSRLPSAEVTGGVVAPDCRLAPPSSRGRR